MFLSKHKNGTYYIIYEKMNGRRGCKSTKTKLKKVALKKLGAFQKQLELEKTQEVIPIRLSRFAFDFLRSSEPYYTDNTMGVYKSTFRTVKNHFGDPMLIELTTQSIENFLFKRVREVSIYAARKDLANLSCCFNRAVRDGYLLTNPCKGIKRFKLPERPPLFYSEDEYNKLLSLMDDEMLRDIVQVAVNTGMRQMELLRLEWSQVSFDRGLITLDNRGYITKTKRTRSIPMNEVVTETLNKLKLNANGSIYLFTDKNGEPFQQKYFSKYFKSFVRKAKLNEKLNFHSLRHTFASWLVQRKVSIYVVSRLLGHSNISTTEQYSHLRRDDLKGAVDILN
jgi:integrase